MLIASLIPGENLRSPITGISLPQVLHLHNGCTNHEIIRYSDVVTSHLTSTKLVYLFNNIITNITPIIYVLTTIQGGILAKEKNIIHTCVVKYSKVYIIFAVKLTKFI